MRLALIHNPRSRKNRRDGRKFALEARRLLGDGFLIPASHDEMTRVIQALAAQNVRLIAINGGDGTVSDVMTAVARFYPSNALPNLAIFPSGNTNLIARDIGFRRRGLAALTQLVRHADTLPRTMRRPLKISWPNDEQDPRLGMFQGSSGYARAIAIAHSPHVLRYAPHNLAVAVTLIGAFGSLLWRRQRETWLSGDRVTLKADGEMLINGQSFLFLSTALRKLNLGIWPFWNGGKAGSDGLHFLHVGDHPAKLLQATWSLLRGSAPTWLRASPDYMSGRAEVLDLTCKGDFVLDGECFAPGADDRILLSEGPEFGFVHD
ncbi:diacylglycerol/lipid kinase family protein [Asaia krungthepensis]|uniref:diacylglycerol/lipid kinase family protein n=1 Tax=Asaia krungthepensis TaxID=220990 RepID=UPI00222E32B6|nr:acylglycerol kinase family protein [Asaia krungthepensis]